MSVKKRMEPIAIIGIGCRFPGNANSPEEFWQLLCDGVDAIREIPADRWSIQSFYDPEPGTPGKTYVRRGGFIEGIDKFDPGFFGISPREAAFMDPQQRLLLEITYEAIEDGGQTLDRLAGSRTGVFIGVSTNDYGQIQSTYDDRSSIDTHTTTGSAASIIANRLSYCFDLRGPSLALDSACSSSLVATHLACRSIWSGESDLAVAGGTNVMICPDPFIGFGKLSMLSPQGYCKAFDATGDGFVRAEGGGVVLLKPLKRALADGDPIYALIKGTAVNQDGRTNGITVPSQDAQTTMLKTACEQAGVSPEKIQYLEAHGTGTSVGDPIEANALGPTLSANRPDGSECLIGSVKTNIGHLEAGAGIAGLIKVALSVKNGLIPPSLHFDTPNSLIDFERLKLRVPDRLMPWPENGGPRYAGVNSFGFGGTNAHILLSEGPPRKKKRTANPSRQSAARLDRRTTPVLLPLSAQSPEALKSVVLRYKDFVGGQTNGSEAFLHDLGYNLSQRRTHHSHRLALAVHSKEELVAHLDAFLAGERRQGMHVGSTFRRSDLRTAFVFSGQGTQWWGMGRELLAEEPVFREMIRQCDALLNQYAPWSLMEELTRDETHSRLHETSIAQPALFALQVALTALWRSWGLEPHAVVGHSVGEIAAAHIAGALSLEDAMTVAYHRGRCMDLASSKGRMMGAGLTMEEALRAIQGYEHLVSLAAVNSPSSVTLSGDGEALEKITQSLEDEKKFYSFLKVNYAFHSPQMDPVRQELLESLKHLKSSRSTIPIFSTVFGRLAEGPEYQGNYWWHNVRMAVRFADAITGMIEYGCTAFVEVGPHPALSSYVTECLQSCERPGIVVPSLRRKEEERLQMLSSLGALYTSGFVVNWQKLFPDSGDQMKLPRYPWQHGSYWHENEAVKETRLGLHVHPLLGRPSKSADPAWSTELNRVSMPYLQDHKVRGHAVFPATGYMEAALAAAREKLGEGAYVLEDVVFEKALFLPEAGETVTLQTTFHPNDSMFGVSSRLNGKNQAWTLHATGTVRLEPSRVNARREVPGELRVRCPNELPREAAYSALRASGVEHGQSFQGMQRIWEGIGEALGMVQIPVQVASEAHDYLIHPAVFDACLQVLSATLRTRSTSNDPELYLPVRVNQVRFYSRPGTTVWSHARLTRLTTKMLEGDLVLADEEGNVLVEVRGLQCNSIGSAKDDAAARANSWLYEPRWQLKPHPKAHSARRDPDFLLAPRELAKQLHQESEKLSGPSHWRKLLEDVQPDTNRLCTAYLLNALQTLGWKPGVGQRVTFEEVAQQLGIVPKFSRLFERFLNILAHDGFLRRTESSWEVLSDFTKAGLEIDEIWKSILNRFPALYAELLLLGNCGEHLAGVLQGKVDPVQLLFPDGSLNALEQFYQDSPSFKTFNLLAAKAVGLALARLPEGRVVRFLEIGGGTAGMTSHVLPYLPAERAEYYFTDVSGLFLRKAEQKFPNVRFLKYQLLDIEKDPEGQGFEKHSFDIILASDVLHATSDLRATLYNVQKLLASEGLIVILESDKPARWVDLVFGLMEGWWRFTDADLRPSSPLLTRGRWMQVLEEVGFSTPEAFPDDDGKELPRQTVFVARGRAIPETEDTQAAIETSQHDAGTSKRWMIFADDTGVAPVIAERLRSRGDSVVLISAADEYEDRGGEGYRICPEHADDFKRLLHDLVTSGQSPVHGVLHFWSLNGLTTGEPTVTSLERAEVLGCHSVMYFLQALAASQGIGAPGLWLMTAGAQPADGNSVSPVQSPLCGMGRVINNEFQNLQCTMIDLSTYPSAAEMDSLFLELTESDVEDEIALRGQARYVSRFVRTSLAQSSPQEKKVVRVSEHPLRLEMVSGASHKLSLREVERRVPGTGQVEIFVEAAGLNFRDVMKSLGIYPEDGEEPAGFGDECAGRIVAIGEGVGDLKIGDHVMALAPGSFSSHTITSADFVVRMPSHLSFEEAATIPVAFLTAYYALHHLAGLSKGERVLIHAATGGVGLAAVQIAQCAGAEVFATAGSAEKRLFLKALGVRHVMDSRSLTFAEEVMKITDGRGVGVVLNSLAGEAIHKGLECLAPHGRFLEIGRRDIYQNSRLGLRVFRKNLSFSVIYLALTMVEQPELMKRLLREVVDLIERRQLYPLPHRIYSLGNEDNAFKYLAQARHIGKVVLTVGDQEAEVECPTDRHFSFRADATYMITGGLGGFGLATARWMALNGARHLVLMGRSGATSEHAHKTISALEGAGVQVVVMTADVSREDDVKQILRHIKNTLPPLRGVLHAAMVLDDAVLLRLTPERFGHVMRPKVQGAWNLHALTIGLPLDFFVLFSSVTTMAGNSGQANYVAANTFLDALAHHRRRIGLPALTVNWGPIADVGYVAERGDVAEHLKAVGAKGIPSSEALSILGQLLSKGIVQAEVADMDWRAWAKSATSKSSPRLSLLVSPGTLDEAGLEEQGQVRQLVLAAHPEQRQQIVESFLKDRVARVLGMSASQIELERPLNELGLDSLMMVELKNRIEKEAGISLPTAELMRGPSIAKLSTILLDLLVRTHGAPLKTAAQEIPRIPLSGYESHAAQEILTKVDQLSDQEVDSLLNTLGPDGQLTHVPAGKEKS
jgi:acyl transferase domain-containing protein/acyl carrier protein/ubiquinone/menaquinone biosynthesis C-methylase UbiE